MRGAARCVTRSAAQYREVYPGSKLNHFRKISQASAVGCGTLIGAVIGGQVADIYGRRAGFLLTGLFVFTAGVLSAFGERGAQPAVACDLWSHAHSVLAFP